MAINVAVRVLQIESIYLNGVNMSNPLQPKCIKVLREEFDAFVINVTAASVSGNMDLVACIEGVFFGFEIKWKNDVPSELQKDKINKCLDAGGKAFFVRSVSDLRLMVQGIIDPVRYDIKSSFNL